MSGRDQLEMLRVPAPAHPAGVSATDVRMDGVVIGELIALTDQGGTPLVLYPGSAALAARSTVDLHGGHIGRSVVLMFEAGDPRRPIVMGLLRGGESWSLAEAPENVEVDADGERMVVCAKERLVLRCGKASITLTRAGKVLIEGAYVLSRSSGVNRVKGGSVQLN
ncbi:MAG: hypothetical protein JSR64_06750 [Nitrospira sp.]|uniref:DUF6484 domain-containing protein n=1 Tax=Thauera sp. 2A1 TaxID=2570191 RepID=UPI001D16FFEC|nr:DUF6484 domain-containing protein [Thauera sp. 2A1]KAI5916439.1 DUF6484 domain-containing protein [Thauera sp. 2A1]MBS0173717.1 hypothetical protein [Nitrospira sp.]